MNKSAEEKKEEIRTYQREYYWKNRDTILEKARKEADECKRRRAEQKKEKTTNLQFYQEWNKQLQERLKDEDLEDWLRDSIKRIVEENNKQIELYNEKRLLS